MTDQFALMRRFCPDKPQEPVCEVCGAHIDRDGCRVQFVRDEAIRANVAEIERLRTVVAELEAELRRRRAGEAS